jgi:hypothetical protein
MSVSLQVETCELIAKAIAGRSNSHNRAYYAFLAGVPLRITPNSVTYGQVGLATSGRTMPQLDHGLIRRAYSLMTGQNVHRLNQMIFVYEEAVRLHNQGWPNHSVYQDQWERELRQFVARESGLDHYWISD